MQDKTIEFAGRELARYLTAMGLSPLPGMDLSLLEEAERSTRDDGFVVTANSGGVCIRGANPRSVLIAVYRLLSELGCRFLGPGAGFERIARLNTLGGDICLRETADCRHRGVCIEGANSVENVLDFIDWLPKLGYNSFFVQFQEPVSFLRRWYEHQNNPLLPEEEINAAELDGMCRKIDEAIALRGLCHHRVGHGWTGAAIGCHAEGWDSLTGELPPEKARLVAMLGGKRALFGCVAANTSLCYSNPEAAEAYVSSVSAYAVAHPEVDCLHVWLADANNNICECDACAATTPTDQYIAMLNELDRRLTAAGCAVRLVLLIYQELLWAPVRERLNNPERFVLMFAPISRTFNSGYAGVELGDLPKAPPYCRNHFTPPQTIEQNLAFLQGWQEQGRPDSFDYDYPLGRAHYGDFGYLHISRLISSDIKSLKRLGLNGLISCQELRAGLPNWLPNYVMGRTLWRNSLSCEALEEEYFAAAYGEPWRQALQYLNTLSSLSDCDYFNGIGPRVSAEHEKKFKALAAAAGRLPTEAADAGGVFAKLLQYHAGYVLRLAEVLTALSQPENEASLAAAWQRFTDYIQRGEQGHQAVLDVYRVIEVATHYTFWGRKAFTAL